MARIWRALEGKSATLFLVAGALLLVFGALLGVEAVTETSAPEDVFGPPGYAIASIGLLALYPALVHRSRLVARIGAVAAAIAAVGWVILSVQSWLEAAGPMAGSPPEETLLGGAALAATGLGVLLAYPLFAVASLRSDAHARATGLLLLAPPIIFLAAFGVLAPLGYGEQWGPFVAGTAQALAHIGIGVALRRDEAAPSLRRDTESESSVSVGAR